MFELHCEAPGAPLGDAIAAVAARRRELTALAREHGAVLFRGFPLRSPDDFDRFVAAFGFENFPYDQSLSNAVRINFTPRVFSANEAPASVTIHLHHEMAQTPVFPQRLLFFCQQPAEEGGATAVCRSDQLFERLRDRCPSFVRDCETRGLLYTNVMPAENDPTSGMGRSWPSTFRAQTRDEAEERLRAFGYTWEWLPDDCLRATTPRLPAVREVAPGRKTFFNQLIAAAQGWKDARNDPSRAITFGDGTPLDRDAVAVASELAEELTRDVEWRTGDVVLADNLIVMHGRRPFRGTRKILASLADVGRHGLEPVSASHTRRSSPDA